MLEVLRELLESDDFQPFRVVLINGRQYDITSPDSIVLYENHAYLAERAGDWVLFRLASIVSYESLVDF